MIIDCISDLHGFEPELQGGDVLIVAGDLTARDTEDQHNLFQDWLDAQQYKKKIVIAGNHDGFLEKNGFAINYNEMKPINYLEDTSTKFQGLYIWGSPWTPTFCNWHFMKDRGEDIKKMWDMIPDDVDILITHGPPHGILDKCESSTRGDRFKHAGCEELRKKLDVLKPKLHVFGHIHAGYGMESINGTTYVNCSIMNEDYRPVNKPIRIIL